MRIVSGAHRGRILVAPKGHSTRPTADRTREAMFNVLQHAAWAPHLDGTLVADIYAGSGALGLEAMSRGAASCLFVDHDAYARQAIAANVASLRLAERCEIITADATRLPPRPSTPDFDLVFLDPPYTEGLVAPALAALLKSAWLAPGALAVVEVGAREPTPAADGYSVLDERVWGAAKVIFLRYR